MNGIDHRSTAHQDLSIQDFRAVRKELWEIRRKWKNIGIELDLPIMELDNIRDQHKDDFDACLEEMVKKWLNRMDLKPTWEALIGALKEPTVGEEALALKI